MPSIDEWIDGRTAGGNVLPLAKANVYRARRGLAPLSHSTNTIIQTQTPPRGSTEKYGCGQSGRATKGCRKPSGPGTELGTLLQSLGIKGCGLGCEGWAAKMDAWGPQGCREHRQEIVDRLAKKQQAAGWATNVKAGMMAVLTGLAFQVDVDHPIEWLVDEAIRRAEKNQCECSPDIATG